MAKFTKEARRNLLREFYASVGGPRGRGATLDSRVIRGGPVEITGIFGTQADFWDKYETMHGMYSRLIDDPKNLAIGQGISNAAELARQSGQMDLDVLNYAARERIQSFMVNEVLQMPTVMERFGMPGLDLPSGNLYKNLTKFDVDMTSSGADHPAMVLLNSMFFNIDPNKPLGLSMSRAVSNLMSKTELQSAMTQIGPGRFFKSIWCSKTNWSNKNVNTRLRNHRCF